MCVGEVVTKERGKGNMSTDQKPIANPQIVLREEFDDWAVLFDPKTADAFGVNPVSVFIWKRLNGQNTIADIVADVRQNCEDAPPDVEAHVNEFIQSLVDKGMAGYELQEG
jgi:SynChlorMet cassette protein ScmD